MLLMKPSMLLSSVNAKIVRLILGIVLSVGLLTAIAVNSFAGFSGTVANKNNKIVTANVAMKLMTTNKPVNILPNSSGESKAAPLPTTIAEIFSNGNSLISIDEEDKTNRKFFEYNGKSEIADIQPGFRQQRPLIVQNNSNADIDYTVEFITREIENKGLSNVFFFDYTKVGGDIPNASFHQSDTTLLKPQTSVQNIGSAIQKIGKEKPIRIKAHTTNIYVVDMGIQSTAGNAVQGAGMLLDIILLSNYVDTPESYPSNKESTTTSVVSNTPSESSKDDTSSSTSSSSQTDPFASYMDYNTIEESSDYGGGTGATASNAYKIETIQQFKHFIEDTTTTKTTWVKLCINISNIKNIPEKVLTKKSILLVSDDNKFSHLDILADKPQANSINPFQQCTFYYNNRTSTDYDIFIDTTSYHGEFIS
ncbi:hypothetical protein RBG61_03490 [Paludicola sp. MB14-C6]|uniref:hypothetical protein n=1 Tax=Paludihabitans sp. MB14-C6 TaxID=3070656 RepID=UPI0027DB5B28|nr:hypothetical protein [Paludicola sp. MB14-C6]WMJ23738.1 hypothetical protein RBG61_03490 [Paludicola sp. MB14-C6]